MIEKDTIYKVIAALRELALQKDGDEKMLLVGSANFMEEMIRTIAQPSAEVEDLRKLNQKNLREIERLNRMVEGKELK